VAAEAGARRVRARGSNSHVRQRVLRGSGDSPPESRSRRRAVKESKFVDETDRRAPAGLQTLRHLRAHGKVGRVRGLSGCCKQGSAGWDLPAILHRLDLLRKAPAIERGKFDAAAFRLVVVEHDVRQVDVVVAGCLCLEAQIDVVERDRHDSSKPPSSSNTARRTIEQAAVSADTLLIAFAPAKYPA